MEGWKKPSEELTSPNAEEKCDIKECIPSHDDLYGAPSLTDVQNAARRSYLQISKKPQRIYFQ